MDAGATVAAMNVIQWALDSDKYRGIFEEPLSLIGRVILESTLSHLRHSLRNYLTRGGK